MTCKNIRGCKLWRQSELRVKDRLAWACEVPGKHVHVYTVVILDLNFLQVISTFVGVFKGRVQDFLGKPRSAWFTV